jgi:hypothetical protein
MARATTSAPPASSPAAVRPSVYDELWGAIVAVDPKFNPPHERESDQDFVKRVLRATFETIPEDDWGKLSIAAQQWYDRAAEQMEKGETIELPPGYADDEEEETQEAAATNGEAPAGKPSSSDRVAELRARAAKAADKPSTRSRAAASDTPPAETRKRAAKAPAEPAAPARTTRRAPAAATPPAAPAASGRRKAAAPPASTAPALAATAPGRRKAAAAPPAPAPAAGRRKAAAPAPAPAAPARRAARAAAEGKDSITTSIRRFIMDNPQCTKADVVKFCQKQGHVPTDSTLAGIMTFTKTTIQAAKDTGHWRD